MKSDKITLHILAALQRDGWRVNLTCDNSMWYLKAYSASPGRPWIYGHGDTVKKAVFMTLRNWSILKSEMEAS